MQTGHPLRTVIVEPLEVPVEEPSSAQPEPESPVPQPEPEEMLLLPWAAPITSRRLWDTEFGSGMASG